MFNLTAACWRLNPAVESVEEDLDTAVSLEDALLADDASFVTYDGSDPVRAADALSAKAEALEDQMAAFFNELVAGSVLLIQAGPDSIDGLLEELGAP